MKEIHLFSPEANKLRIHGYVVAAVDRRAGREESNVVSERPRGGVLSLSKVGVDFKEIGDVIKPPQPINCCSILVYLNNPDCHAKRISGIYVPPLRLSLG